MSRPLDQACREVGFFCISGHGVDPALGVELEAQARDFFAQPEREKAAIAMAHGGPAWRGWFPVGGELTSGTPGPQGGPLLRRASCRRRSARGRRPPLHGPNLFPAQRRRAARRRPRVDGRDRPTLGQRRDGGDRRWASGSSPA